MTLCRGGDLWDKVGGAEWISCDADALGCWYPGTGVYSLFDVIVALVLVILM